GILIAARLPGSPAAAQEAPYYIEWSWAAKDQQATIWQALLQELARRGVNSWRFRPSAGHGDAHPEPQLTFARGFIEDRRHIHNQRRRAGVGLRKVLNVSLSHDAVTALPEWACGTHRCHLPSLPPASAQTRSE